MKKNYLKPGVYIERLDPQAITTYSCAQNADSTPIQIPDGMVDEFVFTDTNTLCFYKVNTPSDLDNGFFPDTETFCYNVPNDTTRIFAS